MIDYEGQEDPPDYDLEDVCLTCGDSGEFVVSRMPGGEPVWAPCPACTGPAQ